METDSVCMCTKVLCDRYKGDVCMCTKVMCACVQRRCVHVYKGDVCMCTKVMCACVQR